MKVRNVIALFLTLIMAVPCTCSVMAEDWRTMTTAHLDEANLNFFVWQSTGYREQLVCFGMCDLILATGGTSDGTRVFDAVSEALILDRCYVALNLETELLLILFFGEKDTVMMYYSPGTKQGIWVISDEAIDSPNDFLREAKRAGTVNAFYKVISSEVVDLFLEVSAAETE